MIYLEPLLPRETIWISAVFSLYLMAAVSFRDGVTIRRVKWLFGHVVTWSQRDWVVIFFWLSQYGIDLRFVERPLLFVVWAFTLAFYAASLTLVHQTFYRWGLSMPGEIAISSEPPPKLIWRAFQIMPPTLLWLAIRLNV